MQVQIGRYSFAVYVKPDLTFRRVWEDIRVGRSWEAQEYITTGLTLKNGTDSIHLTTQPLLDRVVRVGENLVVEIMQEASVEIHTGVLRIVKFFHNNSIEVMLLAISVLGDNRRDRVFNRGNLADIGIVLWEDVDNEDVLGNYYNVYVEGTRVEDCTRSWWDIGAPHRPHVLLIQKGSTTAASVTARASIDTALQVLDEKERASEHNHASGAMSALSQPDDANVNKGPVPHRNSVGHNLQSKAAKVTINFTAATTAPPASVNPNVGDQLVAEGLPIIDAQSTACKSHCISRISDSDIRQQILKFTCRARCTL